MLCLREMGCHIIFTTLSPQVLLPCKGKGLPLLPSDDQDPFSSYGLNPLGVVNPGQSEGTIPRVGCICYSLFS